MLHLSDKTAEQFLDERKVASITTTRNLVTLSANDSVEKAMQILAQHGITSAPVYNLELNQYIGFIDVLDLAVFVSYMFYENFQKHPHLYDPKELRARFSLPVKDVINVSKKDPFWTVDSNESIGFLINNFLKVGIHRVPVEENGKVVGIVSQSDVVRFLQKHHSHTSYTTDKTIYELGLDKREVVSVKNDATLMEAFNTILANGVSGIAVVDFSTGALLNNLSASDLKGLTEQSFFRLEVQLHQLFANSPKKPPVTCFSQDKLQDVLTQIEKTGVHRVFVVDKENKPMSVITLTDILRLFARPGSPLDI